MNTERWIILCAIFATAMFFGGLTYGAQLSRPFIDEEKERTRELEMFVDTMERREAMLVEALGGKLPPNLPAKPVHPGGKVIRE